MRPSMTSMLSLLAAGALLLSACPEDPEPTTPPTGGDTEADTVSDGGGDAPEPDGGADGGADADAGVPCNCGTRICGIAPPGDPVGCVQESCGTCTGENESCTPEGTCEVKGDPNGSWCGLTAECPGLVADPSDPTQQIVNPDLESCLDGQCTSGVCLTTPSGGKFVTSMPACTAACTVIKDDDGNGIEDDDVTNSECAGFAQDGPAGAVEWTCVRFSAPDAINQVSFCMPDADFGVCDQDSDCAEGEGCTFTSINGALAARCLRKPVEGAWGSVEPNGARCDEESGDTGDASYCASGWCLNVCASYCVDDADCNTAAAGTCDTGKCTNFADRDCTVDSDCSTMACETEGVPLFSEASGVPAQVVCLPLTCNLDGDCASDSYCDRSGADINTDSGTLTLNKNCEPATTGGGALGASCDDDNPCNNTDQCIDGYCSAFCDTDGDCASDQLCVVSETLFLLADGPPQVIQSAPFTRCESFPGDGPECEGQFTCDDYAMTNVLDEHRCAIYTTETGDPDAPHQHNGKCIPSVGDQEFGTLCSEDVQCGSGLCLAGEFCSLTCNSYEGCPNPSDSDGNQLFGFCRSLPVTFGGDYIEERTDVYTGVCFFTEASGTDCSADFACPAEEACAPIVLVTDPQSAPKVEYICLENTNPDGSVGDKAAGETCDPDATNAQGISLTECASGLCFEDEATSEGYCSQLCTSTADCPDGLECLDQVVYERLGAYTANNGSFMACKKPGN